MTVFVFGSNGKQELGDLEKQKLDEIIADNHEVLIGNICETDRRIQEYLQSLSYRNVTVYTSGKSASQSSQFHFSWKEEHISSGSRRRGFPISPCVPEMVRNADSAVAIWDGKDTDTWITLLLLASLEKRVCLLYPSDEKMFDICKLLDLQPFSREKSDFSEVSLEDILAECGFSDEMTGFLPEKYEPGDPAIKEAICEAPIPVERKIVLLKCLKSHENVPCDLYDACARTVGDGRLDTNALYAYLKSICDNSFTSMYHDCKKALGKVLKVGRKGRILYLFNCWYDTDVFLEKKCPVGAFRDMKQIETYIAAQKSYENTGDTESSTDGIIQIPEDCNTETENDWYEIELWDTFDSAYGSYYAETYHYYLANGKICWFVKMEPYQISDGSGCDIPYLQDRLPANRRYSSGDLDLSLETPFHSGDVVKVNCAPFGPAFYAVILESCRQYDCCYPNILFRVPGTNRWRICAMKHKGFYYAAEGSYEPLLSPLFRLERADSFFLCEEKKILLTVSALLADDEYLCAMVWERASFRDDMTQEDVLKLFDLQEAE